MGKDKVILICIGAMSANGALDCGNQFVQEFMGKSSYSLAAKTVHPSDTLACNLSLFYSVPPDVHGTVGEYVRPPKDLLAMFAHVCNMGENKCSMFYGYQPLRFVSPPRNLVLNASEYISCDAAEGTDAMLVDRFLMHESEFPVGVSYIYLGETQSKGVGNEDYSKYLSCAWDNVKRIYEKLGNEYTIIVTSDHSAGTDDMTVPMFFFGKQFKQGEELEGIGILDVAPTISRILGLQPHESWQGKPLV